MAVVIPVPSRWVRKDFAALGMFMNKRSWWSRTAGYKFPERAREPIDRDEAGYLMNHDTWYWLRNKEHTVLLEYEPEGKLYIEFNDLLEAVLFKLTWGGDV